MKTSSKVFSGGQRQIYIFQGNKNLLKVCTNISALLLKCKGQNFVENALYKCLLSSKKFLMHLTRNYPVSGKKIINHMLALYACIRKTSPNYFWERSAQAWVLIKWNIPLEESKLLCYWASLLHILLCRESNLCK